MTPPPTPTSDPAPDDEPGYAAALAELEHILDELETVDVDVDLLADRVQRAAELLAVCRRRVDDARVRVETVTATLAAQPPRPVDDREDGEADADGDAAGDDADGPTP